MHLLYWLCLAVASTISLLVFACRWTTPSGFEVPPKTSTTIITPLHYWPDFRGPLQTLRPHLLLALAVTEADVADGLAVEFLIEIG
jgi:hypothetical protein